MEKNRILTLKTALQYIANNAKKYPADANLYPLFMFLGMEKFNFLMKRAKGRRILFEIEYHGVHPILASYEILHEEEALAA